MDEKISHSSASKMEKQQKLQNPKNGDCSDELRDKSYCDEEIHSVDTDNIMSSSVGSQPKENKKIAWDTMLPSKRTNTIDVRTWSKSTTRTKRMSTLRHEHSPTDEIEMGMIPDLSEGLPNEEEMWQKIQQIRSLPITMGEKRRLKAELRVAQNLRIYGFELIRFRKRQIWHKIHWFMVNVLSFFSPWKNVIRSIEANFGTGVGSYFLLIRWQMLLNLLIASFIVVFIVIPWELGQRTCGNLNVSAVDPPEAILDGCNRPNNFTKCDVDCTSQSDGCWLEYRSSVVATIVNHSFEIPLLIQDTVQGTGWLELTSAFYGYYQPAFLSWGDDHTYNFSIAYQLTVYLALLFSLSCIAKSVATGFKDHIGHSLLHQFSDLAFTSWDYCIDSSKVANLKKKAIRNTFRAALADKKFMNEKSQRTMHEKVHLFFLRSAVNLLVVGTLSLAGYIIYLVTTFSETYRKELGPGSGSLKDAQDFQILIVGFLPSIIITLLNFLVPILFRAFVRFERYSATFEIKLTLVRTIMLKLASLLVLVLTLYSSLKNLNSDSSCNLRQLQDTMCWETYVGQQLYRLCIFDLFVTIVNTLFVELPMALTFRRTVSSTSRLNCVANPEFNLVGNTLDMVYSQSICWLGMFYCPVLPMITSVKCVIVFYVKYLSLLLYSSPPSRVYGASSSSSLFMNVLLLSFISCVLPLGYHVTSLEPSMSCGPFRGFATVWSAISNEVEMLSEVMKNILSFFGTAGFFVPAVLLLLVALYYYRSKAAAHRAVVESLTQQLVLEAEDKQFLLSRLNNVNRQVQIAV